MVVLNYRITKNLFIMARVKFGAMMVDARGKLGGHVFTKARSGATIRTKVTPSNPQTTAQSGVRALFASLSSQWSSLDEAARAAWQGSVDLYQKTDVFGDSYLPSGKNLYVSLNSNLSKINKSNIAVPAAPVEFPLFLVAEIEVEIAAATMNILYSGAIPGADFSFYIEATKPNSPGRYNFSGQFRKIFSGTGAAIPAAATLYSDYVAKFGVPAAGQKIAFRVTLVSILSGQSSAANIVTSIATA